MRGSKAFLSLCACTTLLGAGCASTGPYVWFNQIPSDPTSASTEYLIGVGDMISIHVMGHEDMTTKERVRSDGRIALPFIGDVEAAGKRPSGLKAELEGRLKDYYVSPNVVVNVDEVSPMTILLFGEVNHVGAVILDQDTRIAHALALGGGLSDYATKDKIFVIRTVPKRERIRFTYEDIYRDIGGAGDFKLRRGDMVEVE